MQAIRSHIFEAAAGNTYAVANFCEQVTLVGHANLGKQALESQICCQGTAVPYTLKAGGSAGVPQYGQMDLTDSKLL